MRKQVKLKFEVGDSNYVKPGEYFVEFAADGKTISAIYKRLDDLTLQKAVIGALNIEDNKAVTANNTSMTINPTEGKDAMKKVTLSVPLDENVTKTYSIAELSAGTVTIDHTTGKIGMKKATITFTD